MMKARTLLVVGVPLFLFSPAAKAEYRLDSGDKVEVIIAGMKDFRFQAPVDLNGEVALPVFGSIKARGLTLQELRAQIEATLPNKVLFRRAEDGRKSAVNFNPEELLVTVAEYRPVYVSGDVLKSGSVPFRPGMTVRQALALAGGSMSASSAGATPMDLVRLQSERETLTLEYSKELARVWRLESELKGANPVPSPALLVEKDVADRILKLEIEQKQARQAALESDKAHLRDSIAKMDLRIASLKEQSEKEGKVNEDDQQDLASLSASLEKGNTSIFRVSEARRAALTSATRMLQTNVLLADARKDRDDISRRLEKADEDRRVEILRDLQTANASLVTAALRLRAIGLSVPLPTGGSSVGSTPSILVYRKSADREEQLIGRLDMELMPGDVVTAGAAQGAVAGVTQ
ncbi:hypothetical protein AA309_08660 [Microvirga vignae]|uniref:Uncharacterized protein n=1 Tax=Microvirga vignae TaxID=1225564 RepID=A0A0H1RDX6_9HYPH|nr:polysaccharide biosynthesis/export family protein [Microvirga vignae]KLK93395.1 hypothetical protein AA309_08660 [Microvirga vignae]